MVRRIRLDADLIAKRRDMGDGLKTVGLDLAYLRLSIVNVIFFGSPDDLHWVLIDTGLRSSARAIRRHAARRFGHRSAPAAIILTHGHFDHAGSALELATAWDVPVYAHPLAHPYLTGKAAYPPADAGAGGGLMTLISPTYPRHPVDLGRRLRALPADGAVPFMPGWRWLHTPGHAPGHVSLWRSRDRSLIAGDAISSTGQESALDVLFQLPRLQGPPRYFTPDWQSSRMSAESLAALEPELLICGHGPALAGSGLPGVLRDLARNFNEFAVPPQGRYTTNPATVENGKVYRKP